MGMSGVELQEAIKNKAIELGDKLRDNLALDSIAKAQIIKSLGELESFVVALLDAFLRDHVTVPRNKGELLEKLAELEHQQWSHWINYQTKIPFQDWELWLKLANTPYSELSEGHKESDREWARKVLRLLGGDTRP